ncbi:MAG: GMP synthase (glutamine-hydrolyzing) [bacterium ADurb.Bin429]|nr:MAG: GMP synthase (glutamine-hydrolyzing) [bacterium ADurb.Bin429]
MSSSSAIPQVTRPDEFVIVLDFGAQYSQLIARRIRECKVYCELLPHDTPAAELAALNPKGIVLSGGPDSVYDPEAPGCDPSIFELGIPVLGICYGMQYMAHCLGGTVVPGDKREYGRTELHVLDGNDLFADLNPQLICWMSHGDVVLKAPPGFTVTARTENTPVAAMSNTDRAWFGVQFHPEVVHTPWGIEILRTFVTRFCGCTGTWTMANFVRQAIGDIQTMVGGARVVCGLSGGIDSAVTGALVHRAIGDQLTCIFVDHGFLRKDEGAQVERAFRDHFHANLVHVKAEERFLTLLAGVTDPEQKRKIIGGEFIAVFTEEASRIGDVTYLAQGTLYPDIVESGTTGSGKKAAVIKSHHNVGGLPEKMNLKLLEPLRNLFKDEVRRLGEELGLPDNIVWRMPFPGPGLAIRIIGAVTKERLEILREADHVIVDEIKRAGLYRKLWQAFAVLPDVRSVGVMGDHRTYAYPIVLRAVTSEDAMTADWARLPFEVLERISNRLINEVEGVNRLVYDVTSKPPGTIEWE